MEGSIEGCDVVADDVETMESMRRKLRGRTTEDIMYEFLEEAHCGSPTIWWVKDMINELEIRQEREDEIDTYCDDVEKATEKYETHLRKNFEEALTASDVVELTAIRLMRSVHAMAGYPYDKWEGQTESTKNFFRKEAKQIHEAAITKAKEKMI